MTAPDLDALSRFDEIVADLVELRESAEATMDNWYTENGLRALGFHKNDARFGGLCTPDVVLALIAAAEKQLRHEDMLKRTRQDIEAGRVTTAKQCREELHHSIVAENAKLRAEVLKFIQSVTGDPCDADFDYMLGIGGWLSALAGQIETWRDRESDAKQRIAALEAALCEAAIPLEALYSAVDAKIGGMDYLSPEMQQGITDAVAVIRAALLAPSEKQS